MMCGCEKRDDYWTNISSPDFGRDLTYRGYLEIQGHGLSTLRGLKKNGMRLLQHSASQLLRQGGTTNTGYVLRGCPDLPGSGSAAGSLQTVWQGEKGKTSLAGEQPLLYEAVFLLCRAEVSRHDHQGCSQRVEAGLAYRQSPGQRIYAGTRT